MCDRLFRCYSIFFSGAEYLSAVRRRRRGRGMIICPQQFRRQVFWPVSFFRSAVRPTSRRAGTTDARGGCDRRTYCLPQRGEAREGYAQVSFLGARRRCIETVPLPAPRKILRDSPTRRDTPTKTSANSVFGALARWLIGGWCFGQ